MSSCDLKNGCGNYDTEICLFKPAGWVMCFSMLKKADTIRSLEDCEKENTILHALLDHQKEMTSILRSQLDRIIGAYKWWDTARQVNREESAAALKAIINAIGAALEAAKEGE